MASFFQNIGKQLKDTAQKFYQKVASFVAATEAEPHQPNRDPAVGASVPQETTPVIQAVNSYMSGFDENVAIQLSQRSSDLLTYTDPELLVEQRNASLDKIREATAERLDNLISAYTTGIISANQLQYSFEDVLKEQAIAAAIIGVRGTGNLTQNVITAINRQVSTLSDKFDEVLYEMRRPAGTYSDRTDLTQREVDTLKTFANSVSSIAQTAIQQATIDENGGNIFELEERRYLGPSGPHCAICEELAGLGWVPLGTLPPIGSDTYCQYNCRCVILTRKVQEGGYGGL